MIPVLVKAVRSSRTATGAVPAKASQPSQVRFVSSAGQRALGENQPPHRCLLFRPWAKRTGSPAERLHDVALRHDCAACLPTLPRTRIWLTSLLRIGVRACLSKPRRKEPGEATTGRAEAVADHSASYPSPCQWIPHWRSETGKAARFRSALSGGSTSSVGTPRSSPLRPRFAARSKLQRRFCRAEKPMKSGSTWRGPGRAGG